MTATAERPLGAATSDVGAQARDPFWDNAKFIAIVLVVVGHALGPVFGTAPAGALSWWIFIFHMPAFVFIAGYLSRSFDYAPRKLEKLVSTVVVPYLVFEVVYTLMAKYVSGQDISSLTPLDPIWLNWFLAALFIWRLSTGFWRRLRWPLPVAVLICLAVGVVDLGEDLDLTRALSFLPFFVAGLVAKPEHLALLRRRKVRIASAVVLAAMFGIAWFAADRLSMEWLFWRSTLLERDTSLLLGTALRAAFLVFCAVGVAALLAVVPRRRTWFTALGAGTLYCYLLHGLFTRVASAAGVGDHLANPLGVAAIIVVSALVATGLMTSPVRRATKWLVEPNVGWLFRRDRKPLAQEHETPAQDHAGAAVPEARDAGETRDVQEAPDARDRP
ncbi:MAG: hypothetical protein GEV11_17510 [Streptosporangiales bacterium]|nr:hypothetical protein [Streptosporangiales bacterium]